MSTVLNRSTFQLLQSVNTADYPTSQWVINPDLSPVSAEPDLRKWRLDGDVLRLATTAELDAQIETFRADKLTSLANAIQAYSEQRYPVSTEMRLKMMRQSAAPARAAYIDQALNWEQGVITAYVTRVQTIKTATTVATIESVSEDFSAYDATDPQITVTGALEIVN